MKTGLRVTGMALTAMLLLGACQAPATPTVAPTDAPSETGRPTATASPQPTPTTVTDEPSPVTSPEASFDEETSPVPTTAPADAVGGDADPAWEADGVITEGEYTNSLDFGAIRLWWRHDDTYLYLAMEGDTAGWVAVGINPTLAMQGADYVFGYVENGEAKIWDAYGVAPTGPNHPPDEDLGGTNDIVSAIGIEESGITRFEVQRPLDSGDQYDQALSVGQSYPVIVALGDQDSFNAYHRMRDKGELTLP